MNKHSTTLILAVVDNVAINRVCIYLFELVFLFSSDSRIREWDFWIILVLTYLNFWPASILLSIVTAPVYIFINGE